MSFYQKKSSFCAFICIAFTFLSLHVFAQPAKMVSIAEWGANPYEDVVELDGYYYFRQANSAEIEVYSSLEPVQEARLGSFSMANDVYEIFKFNGLLVVVDYTSLSLYEVDGVATPERIYGISIGSSSNTKSFAVSGNKLAYMNDSDSVFVIQFEDSAYSLYHVYSLASFNELDQSYTYSQTVGFSGDNLYAGYTIQTYIDNVWVGRFLVAKMSLKNDFEVSLEYEGDFLESNNLDLHYLKDGSFLQQSYNSESMHVYGYSDGVYTITATIPKSSSNGNVQVASTSSLLWSLDSYFELQRFDISTLNNIELIDEVTLEMANHSYANFNQLVNTENRLIAVAQSTVINIELENQAFVDSNEAFYLGGYANQVAVIGDKLYVPIQNRIDVVDISSLQSPSLVTQYQSTFANTVDDLYSIENDLLSLTYDYFVNYSLDENGDPNFSNYLDIDQDFFQTVVVDESLFILNSDKQILRYNISSATSLYELPYESESFSSVLDEFYHKVVFDDYMVVFEDTADNTYELHLFGNPFADITFLNSLAVDNHIQGITGLENYVYMLSDRQLYIYQIENDELVALTSFGLEGHPSYIDIVNGFLIVSVQQNSGTGAIQLFSLSDPSSPHLLSASELNQGRNIWSHSKVVQDGSNLFITEYSEAGKTLILQLNSAPALVSTDYIFDEDTSLVIELLELDPENDQLQVEITVAPESGILSFDEAEQTLTYEPEVNYFGEQTATIKLLDVHGNFTESEITLTVTAINDTPSFAITTIESLEGGTTEVSSLATDVENDSLTYEVVEQPSEGTVFITDEGVLTYTSTSDFSGETVVVLSVSDGIDTPIEQSITISVQDVNDAPVVAESEISLNEDEPQTIALTISDIEGHDVTLEVVSISEELFSVDVSDNTALNIVPKTDFNGEASITVKVTDELGLSAQFTLAVLVNAVNDSPVFNYSIASVAEDSFLQLGDLVTDVDGDTLVVTLVEASDDGELTISPEGEIAFIPNLNFYGEVGLKLSVTDGSSEAVLQDIVITVSPVNDAPIISGLSFEMTEDDSSELTLEITDVENESVTLSLIDFSDGLQSVVIDEENRLSVIPIGDFSGQATITVNVLDENQGTQNFTLTFNILPVDDIPIAADVMVNTDEGGSLSGVFPTADADGELLTYSMSSEPANGTVTLDDSGAYTYTPNSNFSGSDEFSYTVTDTVGNAVLGKVYVSVKAKPIVVAPTNSGGNSGGGSLLHILFGLFILMFWRSTWRQADW